MQVSNKCKGTKQKFIIVKAVKRTNTIKYFEEAANKITDLIK